MGGAERRVFVTGMGMITSAGTGTAAAWSALTEGRSALGPIQLFDGAPYGSPLAGEARHLPRVPGLPRGRQLLSVALQEVLADAGWTESELGDRTAVVLGTCQGDIEDARTIHRDFDEKPHREPTDDDRLAFANYRPGAGTAWLAEEARCKGPQATVGMVCVSSAVAILHACDLLLRGEADRVIVGGFEAFSQFVFTGFHCIGALASGPLRPFDEARDGTVLAEAAVLMTLETDESCRARGARKRAEVIGGGFAADAFHMTAPDPKGGGLQRAVGQALSQAGCGPEDVDLLCAHGTGTAFNDAMEVKAFTAMFGEGDIDGDVPPVFGAKAVFGHTLGAAGALDAAMAVLALQNQILPPTVGNVNGIAPWDFVPGVGRAAGRPLSVALSTNSAFGGNNAALLLRRVR